MAVELHIDAVKIKFATAESRPSISTGSRRSIPCLTMRSRGNYPRAIQSVTFVA